VLIQRTSFLLPGPQKRITWLSKGWHAFIKTRRGISSPLRLFVFHTCCSQFVLSSYFVQEHKCVLDSCRKLQEEGFDVTYLPVQGNGVVSLEELENAIRPDTSLISVMTVNNETGVIQPMKEIGAIAHKHRGIYFHTDAAQAAGKIPLDVNAMNVDLMSISGHKLYGPKGIGAAYVRRRPRVRLEPIMSGGGQERGLRSGTLPAALAVGMGEAARIAKQEMAVSTVLRRAMM
jgi:cysteine desulfurase